MSSLQHRLYENETANRFTALKREEEVDCSVTMKLAGKLINSIYPMFPSLFLLYMPMNVITFIFLFENISKRIMKILYRDCYFHFATSIARIFPRDFITHIFHVDFDYIFHERFSITVNSLFRE